MQLEEAQEMIELLETAGYEADLYKNYSGRGMYGEKTYGVTTDANPHIMSIARIEYQRMDNMGLDYIYY